MTGAAGLTRSPLPSHSRATMLKRAGFSVPHPKPIGHNEAVVTLLPVLNGVLVNLAILLAGTSLTSFTFFRVGRIDVWPALLLRYLLLASTSCFALANAVPLAPGLYFDFRTVPVALVARRHGRLAGLAVALPVGVYRYFLGGAGAIPSLAQLLTVALFAAPNGVWLDLRGRHGQTLARTPWKPFALFAGANLPVFVAFELAHAPQLHALATYTALTVLSAVGLMLGQSAGQTRLKALEREQHFRSLAFTDALTGASNRRQFEADVTDADGAFLLLLDLDHFKRVNDTHGHEVGDRLLRAFVTLVRESVRPKDEVYRLGGEEFVVLLRDCSAPMAPVVAERVRAQVEGHLARRAGLPGEAVTVSGGLAPVGSEALRRADDLLYAAKTQGRNRVLAAVTVMSTAPS